MQSQRLFRFDRINCVRQTGAGGWNWNGVREKYCWTGWSWSWSWWLEWCERKILLGWSWLPNTVNRNVYLQHSNAIKTHSTTNLESIQTKRKPANFSILI